MCAVRLAVVKPGNGRKVMVAAVCIGAQRRER